MLSVFQKLLVIYILCLCFISHTRPVGHCVQVTTKQILRASVFFSTVYSYVSSVFVWKLCERTYCILADLHLTARSLITYCNSIIAVWVRSIPVINISWCCCAETSCMTTACLRPHSGRKFRTCRHRIVRRCCHSKCFSIGSPTHLGKETLQLTSKWLKVQHLLTLPY